jgi:tetratricopeptide (TPR) repeat protein
MAQLAYEEAAVHYERALEVVADSDPDNVGATIDLLLALGHVHWRAGAAAMAPTFERAADLARAAGDRARFAQAVEGLSLAAGGFAASVRSNDTLITLITEALDLLGPDDHAPRVRLLSRLATELYFTPSWQRGWELSRDALQTAQGLDDPEVLLVALHAEAWATFAPDESPTTRLAKAEAVVRLALQLDDLEIAYRAEFLRQQTLLEVGDFAGADDALLQVEHLVRELRMPRFVPWVRSYQATRAFVAGELATADDLSARAFADLGEGSSEGAVALIGGQQMALRIYRDGLEPMAEFLESMVDDLSFQNVALAMLPVLYHELDRPEDAVRAWRNAVGRLEEVDRNAAWLVYMWALGSTCRYADGADMAEELYRQLLPFADRWAVATSSICFGPMAMPLGVLASTLGWHEVAFTHLENAVTSARSVPAPVFEAAAEVELAHALLVSELRSVRDRAADLLGHARGRCEDLGLASLLVRVDRLRAQLA